jgi:hypothetical protein
MYYMYKSSLRHIHDPVLSSLKMKGIRLLFFYPSPARCLPFAFLWPNIILYSPQHLSWLLTLSMLSVELWNFWDIMKVNFFCVATQWSHRRIQSCSGVVVGSYVLWCGEKMAARTLLGMVMEFCSPILPPRLCLSLDVCRQIEPDCSL